MKKPNDESLIQCHYVYINDFSSIMAIDELIEVCTPI